jgi:predicted branched-subunit amino acid permease
VKALASFFSSYSWWKTADDPRRVAFLTGARAIASALPATMAWGLVTGVAMVKVGMTVSLSMAMTFLVFAGSAQLTALSLMAAQAPWWLILAAATVVNLRFVMFSAALHPFFRHFSLRKKLLLGYVTSDIGFVLFLPRYQDAPVKGTPDQVWFFIGGAVANWLSWQIGSVIGIVLGAQVPSEWSLELAGTLALLVLAVPLMKGRPVIAAVIVAGAVSLAGAHWPLRLGLLAGVVAGIATGLMLESLGHRLARRPGQPKEAPRGP